MTATMTKSKRSGKVFLDWSQNAGSKTTLSPYSLRGRELPTVATPLTWDEVEAGAEDPLGLEQFRSRRCWSGSPTGGSLIERENGGSRPVIQVLRRLVTKALMFCGCSVVFVSGTPT